MLLPGKDARSALIYNHLEQGQYAESTDFGLAGLEKQPWQISKGKRIVRYYLTPKENPTDIQHKVVKDHYKYIMNGNEIVSFERDIEWLDKNEVPIYEKIVTNHSFLGNITYLNKVVRDNQFNVLRELGKGTPNEPYVKMLMKHYELEIADYVSLGLTTLLSVINNETDPTILGILGGATTDPNFATVKDAIIYQIT